MNNKVIKKDFFIRSSTSLTPVENEGKRYITGVIPYNSRSVDFGGNTYEEIEQTAFNKTLSDNKDVKVFYNHDDSKVLGSSKAGTLKLESRSEGLHFSCELPNTSYANDAYEIITRGDCQTLSFGFLPVKTEIRGNVRHLKEVSLEEISVCVPYPAYPAGNTDTELRSFLKRNNINQDKVEEAISDLSTDENNKNEDSITVVRQFIDSLQSLIPSKENHTNEAAVNEPSNNDTHKNNSTSEAEKTKQQEEDKESLAETQLLCDMELNN
jgi:HK97 family phage prohead protease